MKHKLENIKLQQYPGQNVTDMSLDMDYHWQALTTADISDHQLLNSSPVTSVIAPIHASSVPSIHLSDDEYQKILSKFPSTNHGENIPDEIMSIIPEDVTLNQAKILEKTPGIYNNVNFTVKFPYVEFLDFSLQNYVLGDPNVAPCTIRCAHGSNYEILSEWDPGPIYVVQRLWNPGGPSYNSIDQVFQSI